jgi:WD40 repeat protein
LALLAENEKAVGIWDLERRRSIGRIEGGISKVMRVDVDAEGTTAVLAPYRGTIQVWDLEAGKERLRIELPERLLDADGGVVGRLDLRWGAHVEDLCILSSGRLVGILVSNGRMSANFIIVWDLIENEMLSCFSAEGEVKSIVFADGGRVVVAVGNSGMLYALRLENVPSVGR